MKPLNFRKIPKQYFTITLADADISESGKDSILMIGTPTKALMDDLVGLQESLNAINEATDTSDANTEATNELYNACAKVMSRNKNGKKIDMEYLAKILDFEDIIIFFNAYMDFITEVTSAKN